MSTLIAPQVDTDVQYLVLYDVSWEFYEALLREIDRDGRHLRLTYDQGTLEIVSPLPEHEKVKKLISRMIEVISMELEIPIASYGSTTYRKRRKKKGLEPDECYYVQSEPRLRGKMTFEPSRFPPDLAIEVEVTNTVIDRMKTYAGLGVLEIWRHDTQGLHALKLVDDEYVTIEHSLAFPVLKVRELNRFIRMFVGNGEYETIRSFQK